MSDYTIELRRIEDLFYKAMSDYPIYEEAHREELNLKIFRHYKYREVGFETVDMFLDRLRARMFEIMPAFNELYRSCDIEFDPLSSVDMWSDTSGESETATASSSTADGSESTTSTGTSSSNSKTVNYEMPQTYLSGSEDYATAASETDADGTTGSQATQSSHGENTGESKANSANKSSTHQHGRGEPAADMIERFRAQIINVDLEIVNQLSDLFMSLFSQPLQYTHRGGSLGYLY